MQKSRGFVPEGSDGAAEVGPGPALPSRRNVILIVLFFFLVTFGFRVFLTSIIYPMILPYFEPREMSPPEIGSRMAAWVLDFIDSRAALLATVLLYFPVVRSNPPRERRERRGELFTGMVNLHIVVLAVVLTVATQIWSDFNSLYVGFTVLSYVVSTAFWCVVGFHLCEGRYLVPLGGIFILFFLQSSLAMGVYMVGIRAWAGIIVLAPLLGLIWELWALIRAGSGFELFPTGMLPAIRRCARVFLLSVVTLWLLGGLPWLFAAGVQSFHFFSWSGSQYGFALELPIAYLVPLFLLDWPAGVMEHRSRKLILLLVAAVVILGIFCVPFFHFFLMYNLSWEFRSMTSGAYMLNSFLVFPLWTVFVPLSIYRWWVRGRFLRPLIVVGSGICVAGILAALFPWEPGMVAFAYNTGRVLVILLAVPLLFLRIPPPVDQELQTRGREGNDSEESTPEGTRP
jgi:hypothetical protein